MSFLQLAAEKKTSFLVGMSNKFRPFLFCHSFSIISLFSKKNCVSGPVIIVASLGTNPMPVPDCSVVTHSDILVAPTTLTLEVAPKESNEEMDSVCDDPHLIKKVRGHLMST